MKLRMMINIALGAVLLLVVGIGVRAQQISTANCDGTVIERFLCLKMINLRAQIYALDTQREMMQVNKDYYQALGKGLSRTAKEALQIMGPDLPEHRQGLTNIIKMADVLAERAAAGDGRMVVTANMIRTNCATCHSDSNSVGGGWNDVFRIDWKQINDFCSQPGRNPYLCKSMYAMLSTHSYHHTSQEAKIEDYDLTKESAKELSRILGDMKTKGFDHLPEKFRLEAEQAANEVIQLAENKNPMAFEKATAIVNTCKNCHSSASEGDVGPWGRMNPFAPHRVN